MKKINKSFGQIKNLFLVSLVASILIISGCNIPDVPDTLDLPDNRINTSPLLTFNSCSDITNKLEKASKISNQGRGFELFEKTAMAETSTDSGAGVPSYSETNIQVKGVDEADIIKTDGRYIYTISYGELSIIKAYPADESEKLGSLKLEDFDAYEMFIDDNMVLLFGNTVVRGEPIPYERGQGSSGEVAQKMIAPDYYYPSYSFTTMKLVDVSNKEKPKVVRSVDFEGSYLTSRKIDDVVYFVINNYLRYYAYAEGNLENLKEKEIVPLFRDMDETEIKNDVDKDYEAIVECGNIAYFEPIQTNNFITIASISMDDVNGNIEREVIVGSGQNVYASLKNLYVAEVDYSYYTRPMPLVDKITNRNDEDFEESTEKTVIHKFNLDDGEIKYIGSGKVKGTILNQFSMDEYDDNFRIATTIHRWNFRGEGKSTNNIYVLDDDLDLIGSLEDLAPGETIYSARFMSEKAYLVTFKKVDPFFVIDLSNPKNPKVLGKLKIPGYSDYLHPYDENHIIGIGKEAVEAKQGDFAWYQGMKIAIFDVSDVNNPIELHKVTIGDRGTDSEVLHNHKAFLFDREKELLVIPITLHEIKNKPKIENEETVPESIAIEWPQYGEPVFQGAFVYKINLEDGFKLKGRITHFDDETLMKAGYYFDDQFTVRRSLYIGDNLYTMSYRKILINDLDDLDLINEIEISKGYKYDYPGYKEMSGVGGSGVAVPISQ